MQRTYLFETDEHAALRAQIRRFAERDIAPHALEWEEAEEFPRELYGKAAAGRIARARVPGGVAAGTAATSPTHWSRARSSSSMARAVGTAVGLGSHGIALPPIAKHGTDQQRERFVAPVLPGREDRRARDHRAVGRQRRRERSARRAVRDGDHYVVTGSKTFITSGRRADIVTTAVRTGGEGHGGISMLVIERGTPGFACRRRS